MTCKLHKLWSASACITCDTKDYFHQRILNGNVSLEVALSRTDAALNVMPFALVCMRQLQIPSFALSSVEWCSGASRTSSRLNLPTTLFIWCLCTRSKVQFLRVFKYIHLSVCVGKNEPCNLFCGAVLARNFKKRQTLHTDCLISNEKAKRACESANTAVPRHQSIHPLFLYLP